MEGLQNSAEDLAKQLKAVKIEIDVLKAHVISLEAQVDNFRKSNAGVEQVQETSGAVRSDHDQAARNGQEQQLDTPLDHQVSDAQADEQASPGNKNHLHDKIVLMLREVHERRQQNRRIIAYVQAKPEGAQTSDEKVALEYAVKFIKAWDDLCDNQGPAFEVYKLAMDIASHLSG